MAFGLGNFIARVTALGQKHISGKTHKDPSQETQNMLSEHFNAYNEAMQQFHTNEAIASIRTLMQFGDKKINSTRLWELPEKDNETFIQEMNDLAHIATTICLLYTSPSPRD